ncbi:TPA: helix-turn-helix domain-containing protein, partial [Mannheimia haemolytica]|nr:helix-turn-helix domain-containing protein [Mannheimia haemolytica]
THIEQHTTKHSKLYKKSIIFYLFENGIFELKEAVPIVAEKLSLTSHAIYKHLREFKNNT